MILPFCRLLPSALSFPVVLLALFVSNVQNKNRFLGPSQALISDAKKGCFLVLLRTTLISSFMSKSETKVYYLTSVFTELPY